MSTNNWTTDTSGDWNTATLWSTGTIPASTDDVVIDVLNPAQSYTVTVSAGETAVVNTLTLNAPGDTTGGILEMDGTMIFGNAGTSIAGSLQSELISNSGTFINAGTLAPWILGTGNVLFTGTNGFYIEDELQAQGTVTVDTSSISELIGNTLTDGIYSAVGPGSTIDLGGTLEGLHVAIDAIQGPALDPSLGFTGWTELTLNGPNTEIYQWNGTAYVGIETTLSDIGDRGYLDVLNDRDYITTQSMTVEAGGMLNLQAGTVTMGGLTVDGILQGTGTITNGVVNNGTISALSGTLADGVTKTTVLDIIGTLSGTGSVVFDHDERLGTIATVGATLEVGAVTSGQTIVMNGTDVLVLNTPSAFAGTIDLGAGDEIVLNNTTATSAVLNNGTILVENGSLVVASLVLGGTFTPQSIIVGSSTLAVSDAQVTPGGTNVLFQNTNGQLETFQFSGTTVSAPTTLGPNPGSSWFAMGMADFDGNGTSDLLWQNQDGSVVIWEVQNGTITGGGAVGANPGTSWHVAGTGSFFNDGNTSILWQNDNGEVAVWDMNGTTIVAGGQVGANPGTEWSAVATGKFYSDGNTDIVFQNNDGQIAIWDVSGTTTVAGGIVADPGASWKVKGVGDLFGDGKSDIVFQSDNGQVAVWEMNGTSIIAGGVVATNPGANSHIVDIGDVNGDGKADLVLQSDSGAVSVWDMNGTNVIAANTVSNPGSGWSLIDANEPMRFIYSTAGDETLTATPSADEFVLTSAAAGTHTIQGFSPIQDVLALSSATFGSFAAVQQAETSIPGGTMINLGAQGAVVLAGVQASSLHATNFALV